MTDTVLKSIRRDLGIEPKVTETTSESLSEAYVAMPKAFDLPTEFLSNKAKTAHEELYSGYVKKLNEVSAELDAVEHDDYDGYHDLKVRETFNANGVYLHELYFANISDVHSEIGMDSLAYMRLNRDFGTFDTWQMDFVACAQGRGNGWAICGYSMYLRRFINFFVSGDGTGVPVGIYPVLVLDLWEHAYFRDYGTNRATYVTAMMKEIHWDIVEERFKRADKIAEALR